MKKYTRGNTNELFIKKSNILHDFKYDYSLVEYKNAISKVSIICSEHGVFEQLVCTHLIGRGCNSCRGKKQKLTKIKNNNLSSTWHYSE